MDELKRNKVDFVGKMIAYIIGFGFIIYLLVKILQQGLVKCQLIISINAHVVMNENDTVMLKNVRNAKEN